MPTKYGLKNKSGWMFGNSFVNVKHKLPKKNDRYFVLSNFLGKNPTLCIVWWDNKKRWYMMTDNVIEHITHWCPVIDIQKLDKLKG